jgi:UDP-glucose 4-epimerase
MKQTMLVTGGAGFIGSHLVDALLTDGYDVRVVDDLSTGHRHNLDARADLVVANVLDKTAMVDAMTGVVGVFHLAAVASVARCNEDWLGSHRINQSATVSVLDIARAEAIRQHRNLPVVYASSAAVYGDTGSEAAHEAMIPHPLTAYGADKLGSELHARVGSLIHGVPTLGLRFFNVYGPRQDPLSPYSGVISIFARSAARGGSIVLHGDGGQTRDFVHVADVVAHLSAAMGRLLAEQSGVGRNLTGKVLNVCTGRSVTIGDLARLLGRLYGRALQIDFGPPRPGDIRHSCGRYEAAEAALGVRTQITLEDGLTTLRNNNETERDDRPLPKSIATLQRKAAHEATDAD